MKPETECAKAVHVKVLCDWCQTVTKIGSVDINVHITQLNKADCSLTSY